MTDTHYWTFVVGRDGGDETHYGPLDSLADAKRHAMPYWPNVHLVEHTIVEDLGEKELSGEEADAWLRENPLGSEDNSIPVRFRKKEPDAA